MKCFKCVLDEYNEIIPSWSYVKDGIAIFDGKSYCYAHLLKEIGLEEKE